jgi:hypothetical protein
MGVRQEEREYYYLIQGYQRPSTRCMCGILKLRVRISIEGIIMFEILVKVETKFKATVKIKTKDPFRSQARR